MATATLPAHLNPTPTFLEEEEDESTRAKFLKERQKGLGGSDIIHLFTEPQYGKGCVRWLMYDKTLPIGGHDYPQDSDPDVLDRGNELEPIIARRYQKKTGRELRKQPTRVNKQYPWARVNMDRQVLAGTGDGEFHVTETGAAEIKSFNFWAWKKMLLEGVLPGTQLQIQHTAFVTGYPYVAFIGLEVGNFKTMTWDVLPDPGIIELIKRKGDTFWNMKEQGKLPDRLPDPNDDRCKVCTMRKTCRGQERDKVLAAELKKGEEKPTLVQIGSPALTQSLFDREVLQTEIAERKSLLDVVNKNITEELIRHRRDLGISEERFAWQTQGYFGYLKRGKWSGLNQADHKAEQPECHEKYMIKGKPTKELTLLVYPG